MINLVKGSILTQSLPLSTELRASTNISMSLSYGKERQVTLIIKKKNQAY